MMNFKNPLVIKTTCPECHKVHQITVEKQDYFNWLQRKGSVQTIFHYLTPSERELLISGICDTCWNNLMCDVQ